MTLDRGPVGVIYVALCLSWTTAGNASDKTPSAGKGESGAVTTPNSKMPSEYVYKTAEGQSLKIVAHFPDDWKKGDKRPAIVFFGGGGFNPNVEEGGPTETAGDPGSAFLPAAEYFAKRGLVTLRAGYRKRKAFGIMPDKAIEDAISAMRWVRKNAGMLGIDPDRIVSAGGSSGGNLAGSVACIEEFQSPDDDRSVSPKPNAMLLHYPLLDWLGEGSASEGFMKALGGDREYGARISPARHWSADMPPTLILIGTKDPMYETLTQFVATWKQRGAPIDIFVGEGGGHGFSANSPWLEKATLRSDEFLQSIGYLKETPHVDLPSRVKTEAQKAEKAARKAAQGAPGAAPVEKQP